jgi:hypothetical protein
MIFYIYILLISFGRSISEISVIGKLTENVVLDGFGFSESEKWYFHSPFYSINYDIIYENDLFKDNSKYKCGSKMWVKTKSGKCESLIVLNSNKNDVGIYVHYGISSGFYGQNYIFKNYSLSLYEPPLKLNYNILADNLIEFQCAAHFYKPIEINKLNVEIFFNFNHSRICENTETSFIELNREVIRIEKICSIIFSKNDKNLTCGIRYSNSESYGYIIDSIDYKVEKNVANNLIEATSKKKSNFLIMNSTRIINTNQTCKSSYDCVEDYFYCCDNYCCDIYSFIIYFIFK